MLRSCAVNLRYFLGLPDQSFALLGCSLAYSSSESVAELLWRTESARVKSEGRGSGASSAKSAGGAGAGGGEDESCGDSRSGVVPGDSLS